MGNMCDNFIIYEDNKNEFQIWQGLVGAHYTPYVDSLGNLSWTNNGNLPNPPTVNIAGRGLNIVGIVDADTDLPETANNYDAYLVGTEAPYSAYIYDDGEWYNLGIVGKGDKGDKGDPGEGVPTGGTTGQVLKKASNANYDTEWGSVEALPTGGTTGQVLAKKSNTNYDIEWVNQSGGADPATATPLMDGTAAIGSSAKYAREDHVHPLYNQFVRPNLLDNWYFVGGGSQQGGGQFPINQRGQVSYTSSGYGIDRWKTSNSSLSVTIQNGQVDIANSHTTTRYTFEQYLNSPSALRGKTVVGSILFSDGTLKTGSGSIPATVPGSNTNVNLFNFGTNCTYRIEVRSDGDIKAMLLIGASETVSIAAIKLEIGSTQTLAHQENGSWVLNEIPDYRDEFRKCQYYYQIIGRYNNWKFYNVVVRATGSSGILCFMAIPIVPMRTTPTVELSSTEVQVVDYPGGSGSGALTVSSIFEVGYSAEDGLINIQVNASNSLAVGKVAYAFIGANGSGYFMLSADL